MFNALFTKTDEYARLAQALGGPGACALFGIPGSGRAMVYAALAKALDKPLCIVTPGEAEATRFAGDLNALGVAAAVFPARDYVLRPIEGTGREYEYRRLAVLGDMGELGPISRDAHLQVGRTTARLGLDAVIAIGPKAAAIAQTAGPRAQHFAAIEEALPALRREFTPGTAVLVKASHAMEFGKIVSELEKM